MKLNSIIPILIILFIMLSGCGNSYDFLSHKSNFTFSSLNHFTADIDLDELKPAVSDPNILKFVQEALLKDADEAAFLKSFTMEEAEVFLYSWEGDEEGRQQFSILISNNDMKECFREIHYFILEGGDIKLQDKVAVYNWCGSRYQGSETFRTSENTFETYIYANLMDGPEVKLRHCNISDDDELECNEKMVYYGVSLSEPLSVKKTPEEQGEYITSLSMSESLLSLEETASEIDKEYLKVRLNDGTIGWVLKSHIAEKAEVAAIIENVAICSRPDAITKTKDNFYVMDNVAAMEKSGDGLWVKVKGIPKGQSWFKEGWVPVEVLSYEPTNVAVAINVKKALKEKDSKKQLKAILANSAYEGNKFKNDIRLLAGESKQQVYYDMLLESMEELQLDFYTNYIPNYEENITKHLFWSAIGWQWEANEFFYPVGYISTDHFNTIILQDSNPIEIEDEEHAYYYSDRGSVYFINFDKKGNYLFQGPLSIEGRDGEELLTHSKIYVEEENLMMRMERCHWTPDGILCHVTILQFSEDGNNTTIVYESSPEEYVWRKDSELHNF